MPEIARRIFVNGFGVLFSLSFGGAFSTSAYLLFLRPTWFDKLAASLSPTNDQLLWKSGLLLLAIAPLAFFLVAKHSRRKSYRARVLYWLYGATALAVFSILQEWFAALLFFVLLLALIGLTQLPVLYALIDDIEGAHALKKELAEKWMLAIGATGLLICGFIFCYSAGSSAGMRKVIADLEFRGLYAEIQDLKVLAANSNLQMVRLNLPTLEYANKWTEKYQKYDKLGNPVPIVNRSGRRGEFTSTSVGGYVETYAQISDGTPITKDLAQWPLWIHCNWLACETKDPFVVSIQQCSKPNDCSSDFYAALETLGSRHKVTGGTIKPPTLRLLEYNSKADLSTGPWWALAATYLPMMLIFQVIYTLGHLLQFMAIRNRY